MKKKKLCTALTVLLSFCFLINNNIESKAETFEISKIITITPETATFDDYTYFPQMYMQDFAGVKMPNGEDVSKSGNLLMELCIIDNELGKGFDGPDDSVITPEIFIEKYPNIFLENGNIDVNAYASLIGSYTPEGEEFDLDKVAQYLTEPYEVGILTYIPNPSIYGMDSTYLLITGLNNGRCIVRDVNKNNLPLATIDEEIGYHYYNLADVVTAVGTRGRIWVF